MKKLITVLSLLCLLLISCGKRPQEVEVSSVSLEPKTATLFIGESLPLKATVLPSNATNAILAWQSSDASVASVSASGLVNALKEGSATITVTAGGKSAICAVKVNRKAIPVTGVSLDKTELVLALGEQALLSAKVLPENADNKSVSWESDNTAVATVKDGLVTAHGEGSATVTVSTEDGGFSASCVVTVNKTVISVTGVTLDKAEIILEEGGRETLVATVSPENADNKRISWESDNTAVATVKEGVVTGVGAGIATVKAITEEGGYVATCAVTVKAKVVSVTSVLLDKKDVVLLEGEQATLIATVLPENADNKKVSWASDNTDVATVQDGVVTGIGEGKAVVTVTTEDGGFSDSCVVNVNKETVSVSGVSLDKTELTIIEGTQQTLVVTVLPENANNKKVTWSSNNPDVASVEAGVVSGLSVGSAIIEVKTEDGGYTATCAVTVQEMPKATGVSLDKESVTLLVRTSGVVTVIPAPADAYCVWEWSSDNKRIAVVTGEGNTGTIQAEDYGTSVITVTEKRSGLSASVMVETSVSGFSWDETTTEQHNGYPLITVQKGSSYQLHYYCNQDSVTNLFADLSQWEFFEDDKPVENLSIASLSDDGLLTGHGEGILGIAPKGRIQASEGNSRLYVRIMVGDYNPEGDNEDIGFENWN